MAKPEFDVFLSHATSDKPVVEELARILKRHGIEPWLDVWNLVPGEPWQEAIEEALERCAACAVLFGPGSTGPWQNEEMRAAIERQVGRVGSYPVIPVLLPSAERGERSRLPAFLVRRTWVEFHGSLDDERGLHRLIAGIRGSAPGPGPGEAVAEGSCPYRGLQFFDVGDSVFFKGREALTGWLLTKLRPARLDNRFLAIVGPSGSGKSSLARAGLLASLKSGEIPGSEDWPLAVCRPGAQPLEGLAVALAGLSGGSAATLPGMIRDLGADPRMLHLTARFALHAGPADRRLVVLIDQFEEVFTLCTDEVQRGALIANLLHAAREVDGQTAVILTLRSDFYGRCAAYPELAAAISDRSELVGPMTEEELRSAIEEPARTSGLELEGGLADLLIGEVEGQPGCLPLLEHALLQIWERRAGRKLTVAAYREIGGMAGALERHAEEIYTGFTPAEQEACRRAFLCLVQVDEQRGATKRRLGLDELISTTHPEGDRQAVEAAISKLTNERLLSVEATGEEKRPTVELAHEALLTAWKRLGNWIDADRDALRTRRRLDEAAAEWLDSNRNPSFLYRGARLAQAEEWAGRHPGQSGSKGKEFLTASAAQRDEESRSELAAAQARAAQRKKVMIGLGALTAVALLAAAIAIYQQQKAARQLQINLATQMASQAKLTLGSNPLTSLLLAIEAVYRKDDLPDAKGALLGALARSDAQPLGKPGIVAIAAAADRRSIVTVSRNGTANLWSLGTDIPSAPVQTFQIKGEVSGLALSSDRRWLLIRDADADVRLRDLGPSGKETMLPDENWRPGDPFSPDSQWLITLKLGIPVLHDLSRGTVSELPNSPEIDALAYSPDRRHVAVVFHQGTAEIWDLSAPNPSTARKPLPRISGQAQGLAFSPNGRWLAAAIYGAGAEVWPVDLKGAPGDPRLLQNCQGNLAVAVSPEGWVYSWRTLLLPGSSKTSCLWDPTGNLDSALPEATKAEFSSDGKWFTWSDSTGTAHLKNIPSAGIDLPSQGQALNSLFFTQGNRWLITQVGDEAPRVWDLSRYSGILAARPDGTGLVTTSADLQGASAFTPFWALSPDGSWLAAGSHLDKFALWRPGKSKFPLSTRFRGSATALAFDPESRLLGIGDWKEVWILNLQDNSLRKISVDPAQNATALAFDSKGTRLAVGWSQGRIGIFPTRGEEFLGAPESRGKAAITALAFSPDGDWLAVADANGKALLWKSEQRKFAFEGQDRQIGILAFSRDSRQIASGGKDGTVQLWSFDGKKAPGVPVVWQGHSGAVRSLSFTKDGKELITSGANDTVRHWPLETKKLVRLACQKAGRSLTRTEWENNAPPGEPFREGTQCAQP